MSGTPIFSLSEPGSTFSHLPLTRSILRGDVVSSILTSCCDSGAAFRDSPVVEKSRFPLNSMTILIRPLGSREDEPFALELGQVAGRLLAPRESGHEPERQRCDHQLRLLHDALLGESSDRIQVQEVVRWPILQPGEIVESRSVRSFSES